ncbi:MAG: DUF305 domain-containing protein [Lactococcus sp.]|jgi:hypothetical protein
MNTMSLLIQENPMAFIGLGVAAVAIVVMLVFLMQLIAGKNKKRELLKFLAALLVVVASLGAFMYAALTVKTPKSETIIAVMDQINDNQDYQNFAIQANQLTTTMINDWGASGDISPEKGQEIINSNQVKINALIANGTGYLKAIDTAAPKAKLDALPKAYSDYVAAIKENIQISLSMLRDLQTVKLNQYETVDKVNKEYNQALMTARTTINSAAVALNQERGTEK